MPTAHVARLMQQYEEEADVFSCRKQMYKVLVERDIVIFPATQLPMDEETLRLKL